MIRCGAIRIRCAAAAALGALLLLLCTACASADGSHTVQIRCAGGGFTGMLEGSSFGVTLTPEDSVPAADGSVLTVSELLRRPDCRPGAVALRFSVTEVEGANLL